MSEHLRARSSAFSSTFSDAHFDPAKPAIFLAVYVQAFLDFQAAFVFDIFHNFHRFVAYDPFQLFSAQESSKSLFVNVFSISRFEDP